jgi:gluconate kinase
MTEAWLITGIPGAGKSTTARLLATRFQRAAVIEGDLLHGWIVSGNVWPGQEPVEESSRQIRLTMRNQCLLAKSYATAGFTPIVDYVVVNRADLRAYRSHLRGLALHLVVLHPGKHVVMSRDLGREKSQRHRQAHGLTIAERFAHLETPLVEQLTGVGLWIDNTTLSPEGTADLILANRGRARLG